MPVIAKILVDLGLARRDVGIITLGVSVFDDTIGWMILAVIASLGAGWWLAGLVLAATTAWWLVAVAAGGELFAATRGFLASPIGVLLLLSLFPSISTVLPALFGYR